MSKISGCKLLGLAAVALMATAASSYAGFTPVGPPFPGEKTQAQILSNAFGGTFTPSGENYTNGTITATRLDDTTDTSFSGNIDSVEVLGVFAKLGQALGYSTDGSTVVPILTATGKGFAATGSSGPIDIPGSYEFVRDGDGQTFFSNPANNPDGKDHQVTYLLSGKGVTGKTYVLFFEDLTAKNHGDFDFQDLVVEVNSAKPATVPLPAAAYTGMSLLLGLGLATGWKKMHRHNA